MAFTQGAGVLIIASQLPALLGLRGGWTGLTQGQMPDGSALGFGLTTVLALVLARRWRPAFPSVLFVVGATALASAAIGFEASGGAVIGVLPQGLPTPTLPGWPGWETLGALLLPTLVISLVSFLETAASAKVDNGQLGRRWDQDQDLLGQGLAKLASAVSGSFPTSSSFSRSALLIYAGARTGWATVASVVVVLAGLLLLTPLLHHVPLSALAAIVVVAVVGLIKPKEFVKLWRISRVEAVIAGITFATTVLTAPRLYWGVLAGVLMSLSHFLYLRLHPRIIEVGLHGDGSLRDRLLWDLPPLAPGLCALRMDAALDFATANAIERAVSEYLAEHPDTRHVMLFAHPINWIDATGVEAFGRLESLLSSRQVSLHLVGLKLPVESVLRAAGLLRDREGQQIHRTEAEALGACAALRG